MIFGDKAKFAIEYSITHAYERPSFLGLGFFVYYIGGRCYGVRSPEATMLACSLGKVQERIVRRGRHTSVIVSELNPGKIADAYQRAYYADCDEDASFLGFSASKFCNMLYASDIVLAPDGDEAFDDGSHILQFDVNDNVRLIAYKICENSSDCDLTTLSDIWVNADEFYSIFVSCRNSFETEWKATPKRSETKVI